MGILKSLTRQQKEAVGLLQMGTFLEYFDLTLYVHMAVLLNEIFFPKTDPHTASLIAAFAFCSTFVLRPFGALIFGYIGDNLGRKTTVILTTMMMSTSCIVMANLPTYAQIGITAAWVVTICRIVQGLSSMGEIMGAKVYVTEITKPPVQYVAVSFINVAAAAGGVAALGIAATLVTSIGFNWRIAFWIGAGIALVGSVARVRLRETPEFVEKNIAKKKKKLSNLDVKERDQQSVYVRNVYDTEKVKQSTITAFFIIYCGWPLCFYIVYMYFNPILKNVYGYSSSEIIFHNLILSFFQLASAIITSIICYRINPLKILKFFGIVFFILISLFPIILKYSNHYYHIFAFQAVIVFFTIGSAPADSILIKYFPVLKRVTATSILYSITRALMYIITSFGLVYLTELLGHYGLLLITLPVAISYLWAINHYAILEDVKLFKFTSLFRNKGQTINSSGVFQQEDYSNKINKTA